jgi:hypothetical protein
MSWDPVGAGPQVRTTEELSFGSARSPIGDRALFLYGEVAIDISGPGRLANGIRHHVPRLKQSAVM